MKKLFISIGLMFSLLIPLVAQVDHDFNVNDRVPVVNASIAKDQVPAAVLKAVNNQFNTNNPITWSKFPYALKEYGWVYDVGAAQIPLDRYEVSMKTNKGNNMWAVYNAEGELIETREVLTDIPTPRSIQIALDNSQYKGWQIVGNKEIIRYYHDHDISKVEQHLRLTVEKDNVKRSISFNYQNKIDN
jgi:hypothetical protein